jgi:hypothetical protein
LGFDRGGQLHERRKATSPSPREPAVQQLHSPAGGHLVELAELLLEQVRDRAAR